MNALKMLRDAPQAAGRSLAVFIRDVGHGLLEISHNTLAVVGLAAVAALVFAAGRDDVRHQVEVLAYEWLQVRHEERVLASGDLLTAVAEPEAINRATATDPKELTREQAADLFGQVLDGSVTDLEIGAFCLAMRIKGETADEMAGFLDATHQRLALIPCDGAAPQRHGDA